MTGIYTGHHAQHRGLQAHSVGEMYPYTIMGTSDGYGKTEYAWMNCNTGEQGAWFRTYAEAYQSWEMHEAPIGTRVQGPSSTLCIQRVLGGWRAVDTERPERMSPVRMHKARAASDAERMHLVDQFPKMPEGHTPSGSKETGIDWINFLGDVPV